MKGYSFSVINRYLCFHNTASMGKKILFVLLILFSVSAAVSGADRRFTLVIDAGHGGHDSGAKGSFSYEKNINLKVALAFGAYVERNCPDVKVIYTRKTDVFIPLHKRADIANKNKADVFISIHTNALPAGNIARGFETYTMGMRRSDEKLSAAKRENSVIMIEDDYKEHYEGYDPNSPESTIMFEFIHDKNMSKSVELAKYVQNSVCSIANRPNKGVKQDVFLVLRETSMPACLIELGFITTPDEERLLNNKEHIDKVANGIYQAFAKYKNKYGGGITVPYSPSKETKVNIPSVVPEGNTAPKKASKRKTNVEQPVRTQEAVREKKEPEAAEKVAEEARGQESKPVFKVQIMASNRMLRPGSSQFKGLDNVEYYKEGEFVKYTYGSSADYNEIYRLRKSILDKFPQAFIVAFKNGDKMDVNQAIREFKSK